MIPCANFGGWSLPIVVSFRLYNRHGAVFGTPCLGLKPHALEGRLLAHFFSGFVCLPKLRR
jgi:hypothetical protein